MGIGREKGDQSDIWVAELFSYESIPESHSHKNSEDEAIQNPEKIIGIICITMKGMVITKKYSYILSLGKIEIRES